jgi:1-acyl-sn-glycerol-3-phosphate acyltransferase
MSETAVFIAILAATAVAAVALFVWWWKRSPLTLGQTLLWSANYLIAKLLWDTQVEGALPRRGGAIIVANHRSSVDPSFIQIAIRRVVYWMVAREYCETPGLGFVLRTFQVIPVGRGGVDTAATKLAIRLAHEGGLVGMFPEGRINETRDPILLPGRPGVALVALKARVPIIPIWITGSPYDGTPIGPLKMRAHVRVKIGATIDVSPYFGREKEEGVTQEITLRVLKELARLAGRPDFEPQLAGRRWKTGEEAVDLGNGNGNGNGNAVAGNNGQADSAKPVELSRQ